MRTLTLYATGSATGNAVQQITVPSRMRLVGIQVALRINSITDGAQLNLEISRASARQIAVNNAQDSVLQLALESNFVTSGLAQAGVNQFFPVDAEFQQGEFIYLHALVAGTVTYDVTFVLHFR